MKKHFIPASVAVAQAQAYNRNLWIANSIAGINEQIAAASSEGLRALRLCLHDIVTGAENLHEAAEMLAALHNECVAAGYTDVITPDGEVYIKW